MAYSNKPAMHALMGAVLILSLMHAGCYTQLKTTTAGTETESTVYDDVYFEIGPDTYIEIDMSGGYVYGGINPPTKQTKKITDDGNLVVVYDAMQSESTVAVHPIGRERVEELAWLAVDQGFFLMDDIYDCGADPDCEYRRNHYPPAVPLHLTITIDEITKTVVVVVFERDKLEYPDGLDAIVQAIRDLEAEYTP